jgi:hypothetical protein
MEDSKTNGRSIWMVILIILVVGLAATVAFLVGLGRPQSSTRELAFPALVQSTTELSLENAVMISMKTGQITEFVPGDVMVFIPAGSAQVEGTISIINREADMFPEAGEPGWTRPQIVNVEFQDKNGQPVAGTRFINHLEICFGFKGEEWQKLITSRTDFQIQLYNEESSPPKWESLPLSEYPERFQLCGLTDHPSLFALAIKGELPPTETATDVYQP